jgi:hypothetical protein
MCQAAACQTADPDDYAGRNCTFAASRRKVNGGKQIVFFSRIRFL